MQEESMENKEDQEPNERSPHALPIFMLLLLLAGIVGVVLAKYYLENKPDSKQDNIVQAVITNDADI